MNYRVFVAFTVFSVFVFASTCFGILPDNLTINVGDVDADGKNEVLVLAKRSLRGANYKVMTWNGSGYTQVATPEVRTYRGYVQDDPSMRVNAVVEPGGNLNAFFSDGREIITFIQDMGVTISGPEGTADPGSGNVAKTRTVDRTSPTPRGYVIPKYTMRKVSVGVSINNDYYQGMGEDLGAAVARVESRINDADFFYARDMGMAWEIQECVVHVNGDPANWKTYWSGVSTAYINTKMKFKWPGGGGSAGRLFNSVNINQQHTCTLGSSSAFARSLGHEIAHGFGAGHYSSWNDTMSGSKAALGTGTIQGMIDHGNMAQEAAAPALTYTSSLPPHAMEDGANTQQDTPVDINLLENDYDGNGDAVSLAYVDTSTDKGGTISVVSGGTIRYTPPAGYLGMDEFAYHVADSTGITNRNGYVKVYVRNNGLATHILFDETSGTIAHDVGPYQAHGELTDGLTFTNSATGKIGPGLYRGAGTDDKYSADFLGTGDPMDGDLSVSLWVKYDATPSANGTLACKGGAVIPGRAGNPRGGWVIAHYADGTFHFGGNMQRDLSGDDSEHSEKFDRYSTTPIQANTWYHLVMTLDRTNQTIRAWVNNSEVTNSLFSTVIPDGMIEASHEPLVLFDAQRQQDQGTDSPCTMDDFRIYNKVLGASEIADLYTLTGEIPAGAPSPMNGGSVSDPLPTLSWMPGKPSTYDFDVYFGTNHTAVLNATTNSAEYMGQQATESYEVNVQAATSYYWRIDEINGGTLVPGPVWSFSTPVPAAYPAYKLDFGTESGAVEADFAGVPYNTETYVNWVPFTLTASAGGTVFTLENGGNGDLLNDYVVNKTGGASLTLSFGGVVSGDYVLRFHQWLSNAYNVPESAWLREQGSTTHLIDFIGTIKSLQPYEANVTLDASKSYEFVILEKSNANSAYIAGFELIRIDPLNNPPVFTDDPLLLPDSPEGVNYASTLNTLVGLATDADDDPLAFSKVSGPVWLQILADGSLSGTPGEADVGNNIFTVKVSDGRNGMDQAELRISITNVLDAPVFTEDPINGGVVPKGVAYRGTLADSATDEDIGDTLTFSKTDGPDWLDVAESGVLSGEPGSLDLGTNTFLVQVEDSTGLTDNAVLEIEIITAPVLLERHSTDTPITIDLYSSFSVITSTIPVSGTAGGLLDVVVELDIVHTYVEDLSIVLVAPDGTAIMLSNRRGGSGMEHYTGTVFDDSALLSIVTGNAPFAGTYRPEQPFSNLNGKGANGDWRLQITDNASGDGGALQSWTLRLTLPIDGDLDGMDDPWETLYFTNGISALPNENADDDQQNNLQEFIAGTDPTNSAAYFHVTGFAPTDASGILIDWTSVTGRLYRVSWAPTLTNTFTFFPGDIESPQNSYTDTVHQADDQGFYQIDVRLK